MLNKYCRRSQRSAARRSLTLALGPELRRRWQPASELIRSRGPGRRSVTEREAVHLNRGEGTQAERKERRERKSEGKIEGGRERERERKSEGGREGERKSEGKIEGGRERERERVREVERERERERERKPENRCKRDVENNSC